MSETDACPHCGRSDFGNAGARTQHVRACAEEAKKYQQNGGGGPTDPESQQAQVVKMESAGGGSGSQSMPAPSDPDGGESFGMAVAGALDEDAPPAQRQEGVKKVAGLIGELASGFMQHKTQKDQRQRQRAQQADVEPAEDKPQCECGATFVKIPQAASRIECGECGREYRVTGS